MATSGTITGSTGNSNLTFFTKWTLVEQDYAALTSTLRFQWYMKRSTTATTTYKDNANWTQTIPGNNASGTVDFDIRGTAANTNYKWRPDTVAVIVHDPSGTKSFTAKCTLDLSGTSAGSCSLSGTISLPDIPVNPPVNATISIANGGTAANVNAFVGGFSKLTLTGTAEMGEAVIDTFSFYRGSTLMGTVAAAPVDPDDPDNLTYTGTLTMATPEPAGTFIYTVVATDHKGLTARAESASYTMIAYSIPVISATTYRNDGSWTPPTPPTIKNDGTYGYCDMTVTVANIGTNAVNVAEVTVNGSTESTPYNFAGLSIAQSYTVTYRATDTLGGESTYTTTIPRSYINFDLFPSSSEGGAAFGQAAEKGKFIVNQQETNFKMKGNDGVHYDTYTLPVAGAINTNTGYDILTTKNVADSDINGTYTTSTIASSKVFTSISVGSQIKIEWTQFGKMVFANFTVSRGAATSAGSTMFEAVIDPDYLPLVTACSAGYYSGACVVGKYDTNGNFTCRVTAAQVNANNAVQIGICFMLA